MSEHEVFYFVPVIVYTQDRTNHDIAARIKRTLEQDFPRVEVGEPTKGPDDE